jgi:hypothetical protein
MLLSLRCGLCQEFLKALAKVDEKCYTSEGVEVVVIGCGDPGLIRKYKGETTDL